jgi:hypothetical protein
MLFFILTVVFLNEPCISSEVSQTVYDGENHIVVSFSTPDSIDRHPEFIQIPQLDGKSLFEHSVLIGVPTGHKIVLRTIKSDVEPAEYTLPPHRSRARHCLGEVPLNPETLDVPSHIFAEDRGYLGPIKVYSLHFRPYIVEKAKLQQARSLVVRVDFVREHSSVKPPVNKTISTARFDLLRSVLINQTAITVEATSKPGKDLVVVTEDMSAAAADIASTRKLIGRESEFLFIPVNSSSDIIRQSIRKAYRNTPGLEHLLLIGNSIPPFRHQGSDSDYPYGLLDEGSDLMDVVVGRIPAENTEELRVWLHKIRQLSQDQSTPKISFIDPKKTSNWKSQLVIYDHADPLNTANVKLSDRDHAQGSTLFVNSCPSTNKDKMIARSLFDKASALVAIIQPSSYPYGKQWISSLPTTIKAIDLASVYFKAANAQMIKRDLDLEADVYMFGLYGDPAMPLFRNIE